MSHERPTPRRYPGPSYQTPPGMQYLRAPHTDDRSQDSIPLQLTPRAIDQPINREWIPQRYRRTFTIFVGLVVILCLKLIAIQIIDLGGYAEQGKNQRTEKETIFATRGSILDRNGTRLAYSRDARKLTFRPNYIRKDLEKARKDEETTPTFEDLTQNIAAMMASLIPGTDQQNLLTALRSDTDFTYLHKNVDPLVAQKIIDKYPQVGQEYYQVREYPGGALAANVVGALGYDGYGIFGMEMSENDLLSGQNGQRTFDKTTGGSVIPGSERDLRPPVNGSDLRLTLDADIQFFVQSQIASAQRLSGARGAQAVVLDAATGEILAIANHNTFNPDEDLSKQKGYEMGLPSISSPFEPGSVQKVVTAASAIEYGVARPSEVFNVPGEIRMDGVTVKDAWEHGVVPYTMTGIFGKSSNVGTLMIVQRVGRERYSTMLHKFGLGSKTGVELPGESAGVVPALRQWQAGSFANLPIGQGLSLTLLQMASMYQTIANDGVRIPPRIIRSVIQPDNRVVTPTAPSGVRVVSAQTAKTIRTMFQAVVQNDTGYQAGTGPQAAVEGYQIAGKTGTAQQVDPRTGRYSDSMYWITFAGIAPADHPRYVIALMLDNPIRGVHGEGGQTAAPLFHDIAQWLLARSNVPPSPPAPRLTLQVG